MKYRFKKHPLSSPPEGAALVVSLLILVLLTIAVLAFFSRATSNRLVESSRSSRVLAEQVARSGLDHVTSTLIQEIANPANSTEMGGAEGVAPYFYPQTSENALPARKIWTDEPPAGFNNLIRQSLPSADSSASGDSTAAPAMNGRIITPRRWSEPTLTDAFTATDQLPHWIYLLRDGGLSDSLQPEVVGRFAYQVYSYDGLIDINVAGHPSTIDDEDLHEIRGTLAAANLGEIPGIPDPDTFIQWRNANTGTDSSAYADSVLARGNDGFFAAAQGDNQIVSRRDLIRLAHAETKGLTPGALPHVTHFSREVNAPTFSYPAAPDSPDSGNPWNATAENTPLGNDQNPNPLSLRMSADGEALDGFRWKAGNPIMPRRFPLGRLRMVAFDATSASGSEAHRYFGLLRASDSGPWTYTSPDSTSPAGTIKTLAQVAALTGNATREPDFFELLKAAIHRHSLGVHGGNPSTTSGRSWANNQPDLDALPDLQILRIGANIIDQADADSFPTTITYTPTIIVEGNPVPIPMDVYGIENLPYISELQFRAVLANSPGYPDAWSDPGPSTRLVEPQIVPELWNPHRETSGLTSLPESIRFYVTGRTRYVARARTNASTSATSIDSSYAGPRMNTYGLTQEEGDIADGNPVNNAGYIQIASTAFSNFHNPRAIREAWASASSPTDSYGVLPYHETRIFGVTGAAKFEAFARPPGTTTDTARLNAWDGYFSLNPPNNGKKLFELNPGSSGYGLNAVLAFKDHKGNFHPYTSYVGVTARDGRFGTLYDRFGLGGASSSSSGLYMWMFDSPDLPTLSGAEWNQNAGPLPAARWTTRLDYLRGFSYYTEKADPRTSRFGAAGMYSGLTLDLEPRNSRNSGKGTILREGNPALGTANLVIRNNPPNPEANSYFPGLLAANSSARNSFTYDHGPTSAVQTGRVRPGDDYFNDLEGGLTTSLMNPSNATARPIVLNRAIRSVGELGYAFRDMPFKSLDFFSEVSADAALSDFFTATDSAPPVTAGRIGLGNLPATASRAIFAGASRDPLNPASTLTADEISGLADFYSARSRTHPLLSKAHAITDWFNVGVDASFPAPKVAREAPLRSFIEPGNARTWNLLIDVIAQSGKAVSGGFVVEGEDRLWSNVAVDRFLGEVVDEQLEFVAE